MCECVRVKERRKVRDCDARLHSAGGVCMCVISRAQHQLAPLLPDRLDSTAHLGRSLLSLLLNLLSSYTPSPDSPCGVQSSCVFEGVRTEQLKLTAMENVPGESLRGSQPAPLLNQMRPPNVDGVPHQCIHPYTSRSDSEWEERRVSYTNHDRVVLRELWHSVWSPH